MVNLLNVDRQLLIPYLFTRRQYDILAKKQEGKALTNTEKVYYSRTISKKLRAIEELTGITRSTYVYGRESMLQERIDSAINLLKKLSRKHRNKKLLITGSFLYKKHYNDIDVFIITKNDKEDKFEGKVQLNYLPEDVENTLFFTSLSKMCVSNFLIQPKKIMLKKPFDELLRHYELTIINYGNNMEYKSDLRNFILTSNYLGKDEVLSSKQLSAMVEKIATNKRKMRIISKMLVETTMMSKNIPDYKRKLKLRIGQYNSIRNETKNQDYIDLFEKTFNEALESGS